MQPNSINVQILFTQSLNLEFWIVKLSRNKKKYIGQYPPSSSLFPCLIFLCSNANPLRAIVDSNYIEKERRWAQYVEARVAYRQRDSSKQSTGGC